MTIGMKEKQEAKAVLTAAGIEPGQEFSSLTSAQISAIRAEASTAYERKHAKEIPAESTRYVKKRYDLLQIRAFGRPQERDIT